MLKASYYKHMMGRLAQQFNNVMVVAESIKQGVKSGRISAPVKKRGFEGKIKKVDHIEGGYKGRKNQFQNYHTSSQIANINSLFLTRKPKPQNFQAKNQTENFPKKNYQRDQEQLPPLPLSLNEMYQKLLSIVHITPKPLTSLQPPYPNSYKLDLTCEYHIGVARHSIHMCCVFKKKLMQLIKVG
jgi:hypothetical protein